MVNYIVSGLERSGTSLMMQILDESRFPIVYDKQRKPDKHNPKGYYELFSGRIIDKIMKGEIDFSKYEDRAIKVTSYGLGLFPNDRDFKIIYMTRDLNEVLSSQDKMMKQQMLDVSDSETLSILNKINRDACDIMTKSKNIDYIMVGYNMLLKHPEGELSRVSKFLDYDVSKGIKVIDKKLYRNRSLK